MPTLRNVHRRASKRLSRKDPGDLWEISPLQYSCLAAYSPVPAHATAMSCNKPLPPRSSAPHTRKRAPSYIPRPANAFMCFRSYLWKQKKESKQESPQVKQDLREFSRTAGTEWNLLTDEEREPFLRKAEIERLKHAESYPQYKYSPTSRKPLPKSSRKSTEYSSAIDERCSTVALLVMQGAQGIDLQQEAHPIKVKEEVYEPSVFSHSCEPQPGQARSGKKKVYRRRMQSTPPTTPELHTHRSTTPPVYHPFVPMDQIPHLDLSATTKQEYDDYVLPPSLSHDAVFETFTAYHSGQTTAGPDPINFGSFSFPSRGSDQAISPLDQTPANTLLSQYYPYYVPASADSVGLNTSTSSEISVWEEFSAWLQPEEVLDESTRAV